MRGAADGARDEQVRAAGARLGREEVTAGALEVGPRQDLQEGRRLVAGDGLPRAAADFSSRSGWMDNLVVHPGQATRGRATSQERLQ